MIRHYAKIRLVYACSAGNDIFQNFPEIYLVYVQSKNIPALRSSRKHHLPPRNDRQSRSCANNTLRVK